MNLWRTKVFAKLILSRLPFDYRLWKKIGLFRHGSMDDCSYAWSVLNKHASVLNGNSDWSGLELGPGDGLLSAFLSPAVGSTGLTLVDSGNFTHNDLDLYKKQIAQFLHADSSLSITEFLQSSNIEEALQSVGSCYHTNGLDSLKSQSSNSFDLIYSQAVFEHIRADEFKETMNECYRLLKHNGVMSHVVDFKDHLGGRLNNMRFPSVLWEKEWFAKKSGFYTNRIRLSKMLSICENIGFVVEVRDKRCWGSLPIKRSKLASEFKSLSDDDLLVSGAHLVMTRA